MTEQELLHHTLLRDAAADHLAAGKFPLVFKGICAGSLPADFGANVPVAATAGTQGSGLLKFRVVSSKSSSPYT